MTASQLYSNEILPLRTSDTGADALEVMRDFYVQHLPIVNDRELLGIVSEDDILEQDAEADIGGYALSLPHIRIRAGDHLYEVMRMVAQYDLTAVPVVDNEGFYVGLITAGESPQPLRPHGHLHRERLHRHPRDAATGLLPGGDRAHRRVPRTPPSSRVSWSPWPMAPCYRSPSRSTTST